MKLTLDGLAYPIDTDVDVDANGRAVGSWSWGKDIPRCPGCQEALSSDTSDDEREAPVEPRYADVELVVCPGCGWSQEVDA